MNSFLKNRNGLALIGILLAVAIVIVLAYGLFYSFKNTNTNEVVKDLVGNNQVDTLNKAKSDIEDINETVETKNLLSLNDEKNDEIKTAIGKDQIKIFNINDGDTVASPLKIEGEAVAFENNLIVELRNNEHEVMVQEFTTIKSSDIGVPGSFAITLNFEFSNTKEGFVAVYEESAKDGSEQNLVEIPVKFGNKLSS